MRPILTSLLLVCWFVSPSYGQGASKKVDCKFYFTVLWQSPKVPGGFMPAMSKEQQEWWRKKGAKKYSSACWDTEKANFVFVWSNQGEEYTVDVPKVRTAVTTTEVPIHGTPATSAGVQISPAPVGTTTVTSTTVTTERRTETRYQERATLYVLATDGTPVVAGGELKQVPVFFSERVGRWIWSKPTKDVLEDGLKYLYDVSREQR